MTTTIAFTGGRNYNNDELVYQILKTLQPGKVLVGGASGLDRLVRTFCKRLDIPHQEFIALWDSHGKGAGPIRNREMLESGAQLLIAFPGGAGTKNCTLQAKALGIPVLKVDE